jgi:hypothetical protein
VPWRDDFEKAIPVSARDGRGHPGLGREMMMDAGALDANLSGKTAEAEAAVTRLTDASLGQVHQSLGSLTHGRFSPVYR